MADLTSLTTLVEAHSWLTLTVSALEIDDRWQMARCINSGWLNGLVDGIWLTKRADLPATTGVHSMVMG